MTFYLERTNCCYSASTISFNQEDVTLYVFMRHLLSVFKVFLTKYHVLSGFKYPRKIILGYLTFTERWFIGICGSVCYIVLGIEDSLLNCSKWNDHRNRPLIIWKMITGTVPWSYGEGRNELDFFPHSSFVVTI